MPSNNETLFGPEPMLDFELGLGASHDKDTSHGQPITLESVALHLWLLPGE